MAKYRRKMRKPKRRARKARKTYRAKRAKRGVTKRVVKKLIASSEQLLNTDTMDYTAAIYTYNSPGGLRWWAWAPGNPNNTLGSMWDRTAASQFGEMSIGNYMKVRKWWIKGMISQEAPLAGYSPALNSTAGYIDVYFGKYRYETARVGDLVPDFYQDGTTFINPTGAKAEMMIPMNKNKYVIYWHKRIKVGTSTVATTAYRFSIPCTQYILKNRKLFYGPGGGLGNNLPQSNDAEFCTVWAVFHPSAGILGPPSSNVPAMGTWSMTCSSTASYHAL